MIEIIQGARGGYRLLVSPHRITLLDVVETFTGEIFLNDCIMNPDSCVRSPDCAVHIVWQKARTQLRETLGRASFQDLLDKGTCTDPPDHSGKTGR
jgi:Rrf2 family protein